MDEHELYFQSLSHRAEELRPLLERISLRESVIEDRLALESLQLNPDRLKSRGANSFAERKREEAMRREVKSLDRITTEVFLLSIDSVDKLVFYFYLDCRFCSQLRVGSAIMVPSTTRYKHLLNTQILGRLKLPHSRAFAILNGSTSRREPMHRCCCRLAYACSSTETLTLALDQGVIKEFSRKPERRRTNSFENTVRENLFKPVSLRSLLFVVFFCARVW